MIRPWRRTGGRPLVQDRWIDLHAESWVTGRGAVLDPWYMLHWRPWVHVLALTAEDQVLVVRQWRPGAGAVLVELPGGVVDEEGEGAIAAAAARELREETGYEVGRLVPFASPFSEPAHATNRVHFFLGTDARRVAEPVLDAGEDLVVEAMGISELLRLAGDGASVPAMHIGAIHLGLLAAGRLSLGLTPAAGA